VTFRLQCHRCRHFEWGWLDEDRCTAFPDGIPDAIWLGDHDHEKAYPGDGGVRRLPIDPAAVNPRDVRHNAFWTRAIEPLPHLRDPLGAIVIDVEAGKAAPDPEMLQVAWTATEDAPAVLLVLLRARRVAQLARAIQVTVAQLEAEGCDFADDQGWLSISLTLAPFGHESMLANGRTVWAALASSFGHPYIAARTQQMLLRNMRRVAPDPPAVIEWTESVGMLTDAEALRVAPATSKTPEDLELLAPWTQVTNAAGLEAELARELGPEHRLHGRNLRAVARRSDGEEVLFVGETLAAVVTLNWKKDVDPSGPAAEIYPSLDEWALRRMQRDHHDFTGAEPRMFAFAFRSTLTLQEILERMPDAQRWDWTLGDSQWYGAYVWAKRGTTRVRIFSQEDEGRFVIQIDLVDRADEGEGWFAMMRALATKTFLPAADATDIASTTPSYD
jgi:hypothetical protein